MPSKCKCCAIRVAWSDSPSGSAYAVQHCPLHTAAEEMRALLQTLTSVCPTDCVPDHNKARALLARIEEENNA